MLATSSFPPLFPFPTPASQTPSYVQGVNNHASASSSSDSERPNDQQHKKTYLSLLPTAQLIELCLTFEQYVPLAVRTSLWPADLESAILALQKPSTDATASPSTPQSASTPVFLTSESAILPTATATPIGVTSQQVHPGAEPFNYPLRPLDASFPSPAVSAEQPKNIPPPVVPQASTPSVSDAATQPPSPQPDQPQITAPAPVPHASLSTIPPQEASSPSQPQPQLQSQNPAPPAQGSQTPHTPAPPQPATADLHGPTPAHALAMPPTPAPVPYPYAAYGYPQPQQQYPQAAVPPAAYPHAPYYPSPVAQAPAAAPAYSYPGYPPYPPPNGYAIPPPPPQDSDLPSYEDMLVEALMDMNEEGAAPKDMYIWMAQRWPLQTNFRPSASQALSKARERGRFEKMEDGRYRLNPNWEGGATSKRTTRRPQTLAQTTYAMHHPPPPPSSPFTHAPLARGASAVPGPPPQHQPYPGYTYPYPGYGAYPGYPAYAAHPPHAGHVARQSTRAAPRAAASTSKTVDKPAAAPVADKGKAADASAAGASDEAGDAWEAAQHILKAINFAVLAQDAGPSAGADGARTSASAPSAPVMASLETDGAAGVDDGLGRATLTDEERASLQAQLALLAAQLSEIAELELVEEDADEQRTQVLVNAQAHTRLQAAAASIAPPVEPPSVRAPLAEQLNVLTAAPQPQRIIIDVNQFPDEHPAPLVLADELPAAFDIEAAVNSIASLAATQAVHEARAGSAVSMDVDMDPVEGENGSDEDSDEDMEMVC